jgi:hypothetical protein
MLLERWFWQRVYPLMHAAWQKDVWLLLLQVVTIAALNLWIPWSIFTPSFSRCRPSWWIPESCTVLPVSRLLAKREQKQQEGLCYAQYSLSSSFGLRVWRLLKYIISDLARVAKRAGGITCWAAVFQELGSWLDPVQLIELRQQLHCIACHDDWQEFATCIGKMRQALGMDGGYRFWQWVRVLCCDLQSKRQQDPPMHPQWIHINIHGET